MKKVDMITVKQLSVFIFFSGKICLLVFFLAIFVQGRNYGVDSKESDSIKLQDAPTIHSNPEEFKYLEAKNIKGFITALNEVGRHGYKLEHLTKYPLIEFERFDEMRLAAIVKLNEGNTYEYDWFEAFTPGEVVTNINSRAANGYYFRDILPVSQDVCEDNPDYSYSPDNSAAQNEVARGLGYLQVSQGSIIFVERKNGIVNQNDYRVGIAMLGWGKHPTTELENTLNAFTERGFRPVAIGSHKLWNKYAFMILAEKKAINQNVQGNQSKEVFKAIRAKKDFEDEVNRHGKEGYTVSFNVVFGAYRYILMNKDGVTKNIREYKWVFALNKDFQKQLKEVSNRNGHYLMASATDFNCDSIRSYMLFEIDPSDKAKYEYKILKMSNDIKTGKKRDSESKLTQTSENTPAELQQLLKQGFIICDLFYDKGINVLLKFAQ